MNSIKLEKKSVKGVHKNIIFKRIILKVLRFDQSDRNKWMLTDNNKLCSFEYTKKINEKCVIVCRKISSQLKEFYDYPFSSLDLNVFFVDENYDFDDFEIACDSIKCKMFAMPSSGGFVFFPITTDYYL